MLIAAEWLIYGRFGYGPATEHQTLTVTTTPTGLRNPPQGTVAYVDKDAARTLAPQLFEQHRRRQHGEISRPDRFWDIDFGIIRIPSWPEPKPSLYLVARDEQGSAIGFAEFRYEHKAGRRRPRGEAEVRTLLGTGVQGEALLWDHLLSLDLVDTVRVGDRPADDLLPWLLSDSRLAVPSDGADFLWVRPLDPAAMLRTRSYPCAGGLVLEIVDSLGPAAGRLALDAGPDGATCTPTTRSADLTMDVAVLGSLSLGGHSPSLLAAAGLIEEHTPGALATADVLLLTAGKPWCTTWF